MRRFVDMTNVAKLAVAAAAVVIVAVVSLTLLSPSYSPAATTQPGSSATATSVGLVLDSLVERQTVTEDGVRFSVRVPTKAGWAGWERFNSATRGTRVTRAIAPSRSAM